MQLRTLGGLGLEGQALRRPKPLLLLAYLSLEGQKSRRFLGELFFRDARDASDALSTTVKRLRRAGLVEDVSGSVRALVRSDAVHILQLLDAGAIDQALSLYGGPFLADVPVSLGHELEEWVYGTRELIANRVRRALLVRAEAKMAAGDDEAAAEDAEGAFSVAGAPDPGSDDLLRFVRLLSGRRSGAAARIAELAAQLAIGLDETEEPGTPLSADPAPTPSSFQAPLTSLVGRDEELREIARLLDIRACRLLNLHGPAGVGKSHLAMQATADQHAAGRFPGGVVFVPTDTLTNWQQVIGMVAGQLGAPLDGQADPFEAIAHEIGSRRLLIVLDGLEHLIAPRRTHEAARVATHLRHLLRICPGLKVLITSRQRMNLAVEWVMPITGLRVPDDALSYDDALLAGALQLFVRRAQTNDVGFRLRPEDLPLARRICQAVEGFPLGIELAAAWTRMLPLSGLAESLETNLRMLAQRQLDVGGRHPNLWAALEHSWELLATEEREALAKLAVFRGGFRKEAADHVAQASMTTLTKLVDLALVRMRPDGRFDLHALLGQFTLDKLRALGRMESTVARHAEYFSHLLSKVGDGAKSDDLHAAFRLVQQEEANLLASLHWAASNQRADVLVGSAELLGWYFPMSGRFLEGERLLAQAQEQFSPANEKGYEAMASLLLGRAWLSRYAGSLPQASRLSAEGERFARSAGSDTQLVRALDLKGQVLTYEGSFENAREALAEGVDLARMHDDPLRLTRILSNLALVESLRGESQAADDLLDEAMQPFDLHQVPPNLDAVAAMLARGVNAWCRFDYPAAITVLSAGIGLARELEYMGPVPLLKALLAKAVLANAQAEDRDEVGEVQRLIGVGATLAERSRESMATSMLHCAAAALALHLGDVRRAEEEARSAYTVSRQSGNTVTMLWSLPYLARALHAQGDSSGALQLTRFVLTHPSSPRWMKRVAGEFEAQWVTGAPSTVPPSQSSLDEILGFSWPPARR